MKKHLATAFIFFAVFSAFCASFGTGKTVYVSVKSATVKNGTSFFSKNAGNVFYGDSGTIIESNSKKSKVKFASGVSGWISNGSLTSKKIVASSNGASRVSSSELANAGKGFSAEAENAFKSGNKELDYENVDKMEKIAVSEPEIESFIAEGHLTGGEE